MGAICTGVILTGGQSRRMGRDKASLSRDGRSLVEIAVSALTIHGCDAIVVGPHRVPGARTTREEPPGGGPVAGIDAAVQLLKDASPPSHALILATDLPHIDRLVARLVQDLDVNEKFARVPIDATGHPQPLAACYPFAALTTALEALPRRRDIAARRLLDEVPWRQHSISDDLLQDADTPEDADRHRLS